MIELNESFSKLASDKSKLFNECVINHREITNINDKVLRNQKEISYLENDFAFLEKESEQLIKIRDDNRFLVEKQQSTLESEEEACAQLERAVEKS